MAELNSCKELRKARSIKTLERVEIMYFFKMSTFSESQNQRNLSVYNLEVSRNKDKIK